MLNEFFHNVCELDLVFNFYKVMGGYIINALVAYQAVSTTTTQVFYGQKCKIFTGSPMGGHTRYIYIHIQTLRQAHIQL